MIIADAFYQTHGVHLNNFIHNYFLNIRTISKITDKQIYTISNDNQTNNNQNMKKKNNRNMKEITSDG